jgi:hypothetical protein
MPSRDDSWPTPEALAQWLEANGLEAIPGHTNAGVDANGVVHTMRDEEHQIIGAEDIADRWDDALPLPSLSEVD